MRPRARCEGVLAISSWKTWPAISASEAPTAPIAASGGAKRARGSGVAVAVAADDCVGDGEGACAGTAVTVAFASGAGDGVGDGGDVGVGSGGAVAVAAAVGAGVSAAAVVGEEVGAGVSVGPPFHRRTRPAPSAAGRSHTGGPPRDCPPLPICRPRFECKGIRPRQQSALAGDWSCRGLRGRMTQVAVPAPPPTQPAARLLQRHTPRYGR